MEPTPVIDMDLDLIEAELNSTSTIDPPATDTLEPIINQTNAAEDALCTNRFDRPEAIYLFGLDNMSTNDIQYYCRNTALKNVEWIDDSSCVLVFGSVSDAQLAAQELLQESNDGRTILNSTDLRNSKPFERPDFVTNGDDEQHDPTLPPVQPVISNLQIRMATDSDIKTRGARHRSRYYLIHGDRQPSNSDNRSNRSTADGKPRSILDRLGSRVPPLSVQRRGRQDRRYRHQNNDDDDDDDSRNSSRYDRRSRHSHRHSRRRSLSPTRDSTDYTKMPEHENIDVANMDNISPPQPTTADGDDDKPYEIPENVRSRLGQLD